MLRVRGRGARPRRPPADAGLRDDRPRHRHEPAPVRAVRLGRHARLRPRQGDDGGGTRGGQGVRALQGRRRRRHPVSHLSRHASDKGAYFTRGTSRNPQAQYSERGPDYIYNMQRLLQKFDTAKSLVPQPVETKQRRRRRSHGVIYFGSTSPAMAEAIEHLQKDGIALDMLRLRAFPFPDSVRDFIDAHESVFVVEQNRDAQLRSLLVNEFGIDPARLVAVLHYDGTPITARFIADAIAAPPAVPRAQEAALSHDLHRQAEAPPPVARLQRGRLHPPRLRRQDQHAVRRLRPRLDLGGDHPGLLGTGHRAAPRRQAVRHRLQLARRRTISSASRTASTPCTGACRRC